MADGMNELTLPPPDRWLDRVVYSIVTWLADVGAVAVGAVSAVGSVSA